MLDPEILVDAFVGKLRLIPSFAAAMTVNATVRINAFHYLLGQENRLVEAVYKMPAPSAMLVWEGTRGGNFDGQTMWKHRFGLYLRMGNAAGSAVGYERLWWLICNELPTGSPVNIRYVNIYPGLEIMDTPSVEHAVDEDQIDRFKGLFVIPEIGDN